MENEPLILSALMEIKQAQGRIEQKVDDAATKLESIEIQTIATNGRVGALERWKSFQKGKTVAVAGLVSLIISILTLAAYVKWH